MIVGLRLLVCHRHLSSIPEHQNRSAANVFSVACLLEAVMGSPEVCQGYEIEEVDLRQGTVVETLVDLGR